MTGASAVEIQKRILLETLRATDQGEWKVLLLDGGSKKLVDGVVKEDDILELNVTNQSSYAAQHIAETSVLNLDYYPRESHLITLRDPWSFPTLYHPACNHLVRQHMADLAQKIVAICVSLGEYPTIRYYNPRNPSHEASVLCSHLARFVQTQLDQYAKYDNSFPPQTSRPRGLLLIVDRTMDLFAPLLHEFTYQAMVHDLLPLIEGDKTYYKVPVGQTGISQQGKDQELSEKDGIWVKYRHLHMKDLLDELVKDFNAFKAQNPQFANSDDPATINSIKDMLAGLPKYQEGKEAYSLHLSMTQDAMNSLATGLDEEYKKPKNVADQIIRLLDDDAITFPDRLRLIIQYLLYRDGLLPADIQKLLAHAQLPAQDSEVIYNLELLGAHVTRNLKDTRPAGQYILGKGEVQAPPPDESGLSRFEPALKVVLEDYSRGTLDQIMFPFTKPHLDAADGLMGQGNVSQASLRSAKPTWARTRPSASEPRQRIIAFMAGGATYSESRACYEISQSYNKDVYLTTTHMLTPSLYLRQVGDLSVDRRQLDLPADRPKPRAPEHLFEKEMPPLPQTTHIQKDPRAQPPTEGMQKLRVGDGGTHSRSTNGQSQDHKPPQQHSSSPTAGKLSKDKERDGEKKKKHHFFSSKK
ncbi:MAG: hypothetical protein Q9222_000989 [Ikaeria aurantiellina]